MKHFSRPKRISETRLLLALGAVVTGLALTSAAAHGQALQLTPIFENPMPTVAASEQGYLGISIADVDADKAQALKLKQVRGAVITLIDHDAPAGQIGLKVNDVVLELNGQNIQDADQMRRMLKEFPPGRKITLQISRDGNLQVMTVQLVDRKAMDSGVWKSLGTNSTSVVQPAGMGMVAGSDAPIPGGFHFPFFGSTLKVGALVEPLTTQMAAYLGVDSGLMVKQVARKSEAEAAGFRVFDVILKVGPDSIATSADWDRALRIHQGKPVQVTILRDKKQQTLTLQVDSKRHRQSQLQREDLFGTGSTTQMAERTAEMERAQTIAAIGGLRMQAIAIEGQQSGTRLI